MANVNSPFGFKPIRKLDGSPYCGEVHAYFVPSSDANNMFKGDLVDIAGSSNSSTFNGFKAGTLPTVALATAGATNRILGAIVDIRRPTDIDDSLRNMYRVASTDTIVFVALANDTIFECQNDEDLVAGDVGSNADFVVGSGGSTATGFSSHQLDSSSIGAGATKQLFIHRLANREDNALGNYAIAEVVINLPRISPDTAGI